jgi:hypothetical protein
LNQANKNKTNQNLQNKTNQNQTNQKQNNGTPAQSKEKEPTKTNQSKIMPTRRFLNSAHAKGGLRRSHTGNFRTLGKLLKILPFVRPNIA